MIRKGLLFLVSFALFVLMASDVSAAPYFYLSGPDKIYPENSWLYSLYVFTDSSTITAAQAVVNFNENVVDHVSVGNLQSVCSFWAPADPSLGFGTTSTPYFRDSNKLVASCGFSNPGYDSGSGQGGLVLQFQVTPSSSVTVPTSTSMTISDTKFIYVGNEIAAGTSPSISFVAYESTAAAVVEPTATPTPQVSVDTLGESELEFVDVASGSSSTTTSVSSSGLNLPEVRQLDLTQQQSTQSGSSSVASLDNAIPPPPDNLEKRAPVTPLPTPLTPEAREEALGEVLSIQSLRELLVPGKSEADQRIVWVNLLSALTFLVVLAILTWRLVTVSRMNKLKSRHMKELLTGELSVLESRMTGSGESIDEKEFSDSIEKLKEDLENT